MSLAADGPPQAAAANQDALNFAAVRLECLFFKNQGRAGAEPMSEPFEFDISVSADKRRRRKGRRSMSGAVETSSRICEHPKCRQRGKFRAPKSPDHLDEFYWFCQKHVREYNLKWDFFKARPAKKAKDNGSAETNGRSAEDQQRSRQKKAWQRLGIEDPLEILGEKGTSRTAAASAGSRRLLPDERRALEILDAQNSWSKKQIRQQYKSLVKVYHPDLNGGDRSEEDRLKKVVWAWDQIKSSKNLQS